MAETLALVAFFEDSVRLGVPLALLASDPKKVAGMYRQQLNLLWAGARSAAKGA